MQAASPETAIVGRIFLGDWQGGECLFIPSKPDDDDGGKEDDGYLVTFVTPFDGSNSGTSLGIFLGVCFGLNMAFSANSDGLPALRFISCNIYCEISAYALDRLVNIPRFARMT